MNTTESNLPLVQDEQVRRLFSGIPASIVTGTALAALLAYAQHVVIDGVVIAGWFGLIVAIAAGRAGLAAWYRRAAPTAAGNAIWLRRIRLSVLVSGAGWGLAGWLLFPTGETMHQTFVAFVLAGLSAGATAAYAADIVCVIAFLLPALLPFVLRLFVEGGEFSEIMGFAVTLFAVFMLAQMRNVYQRMRENIVLRIEEVELQRALRETERRLNTILESVHTGIVTIDPDTHTIVDVNAAAASMIGAPKDAIVGSVCHQSIGQAAMGKCPITDLHQTVDHAERVLLTATGEKRAIIKSVTKVMLDGKVHLLESFIDITERKRMEEQLNATVAEKEVLVQRLNELAIHDGLTGLYNHREFYVLLEDELARTQRFGKPVSLLLLDIDHFKRVNDLHGHQTGDAVLKALSDLLGRQARVVDRVCRYGGEEFTVILPEVAADAGLVVAERLRAAVEAQPINVHGDVPLRITVSIGIASFPAHADNARTLVAAADAALYAAKSSGRNRIITYTTALIEASESR